MAQWERTFKGTSVGHLESVVRSGILEGSASATLEGESHFQVGDVSCTTLVFERYSVVGGNRVSLTVTLVGTGGTVAVSGIASGGSQAVFWKVNTLGEEAFLDELRRVLGA